MVDDGSGAVPFEKKLRSAVCKASAVTEDAQDMHTAGA